MSCLLVPSLLACRDASEPPDRVAAELDVVDGQDQDGELGAALPLSLEVRARNEAGQPIEGLDVVWAVTSGDGSLSATTTRTDADGLATVDWTLGARLDVPQRATATVEPLPPLEWRATASIPASAVLTRESGNGQQGLVGTTLAEPLRIRLTLGDGRPIRGAQVAWSAPSGGGSILTSASATDAEGRATATVALGSTAGAHTYRAAIDGGPSTDFSATALPPPPLRLALEVVVPSSAGLNPIYVTSLPGDPRLFIVDVRGAVYIMRDGVLDPTPLLDIRDLVRFGGEQGLLSIALHPSFASNGHLYVNYTDLSGHTVVERYTLPPGAATIDRGTAKRILFIEQPYANHNGGLMRFGPDGLLYIATGDGGGGGDPLNAGQDLGTLLGKMLRIDVNGGDPYAIPPGNPFVGRAGARPEIWALGLRNPWQWSFDPPEGTLYIGDVGQGAWEEINAVPWTAAGINYGWNIMEGAHCYAATTCETAGLTLPVVEYDHSDGCSVIGGVVYRGTRIPELVGHFVYADFCRPWMRAFRLVNGAAAEHREWDLGLALPNAFGVDGEGELYVTSAGTQVFRIVRAP